MTRKQKSRSAIVVVIVAVAVGALLNSGGPLPSGAHRKTGNNATDLPRDLFVGGSDTNVMNKPLTRATTAANKIVNGSDSTPRVRTGSGSDRIIVNADATKKGLVRLPDEVPATLAGATKILKADAENDPL